MSAAEEWSPKARYSNKTGRLNPVKYSPEDFKIR
jgi:hypothetical protein